jgi:hypothetical protein
MKCANASPHCCRSNNHRICYESLDGWARPTLWMIAAGALRVICHASVPSLRRAGPENAIKMRMPSGGRPRFPPRPYCCDFALSVDSYSPPCSQRWRPEPSRSRCSSSPSQPPHSRPPIQPSWPPTCNRCGIKRRCPKKRLSLRSSA